VFVSITSAVLASFFNRFSSLIILALLILFISIPHLKPIIAKVPESSFSEKWKDKTCLQSTPSSCGPASINTILSLLGYRSSEKEIAKAAHTYLGGIEAWYLARYVRSKNFRAKFDFKNDKLENLQLPALIGVKICSAGHFIVLLNRKEDQLTISDPLRGTEIISFEKFKEIYQLTNFRLSITK
jgi:ABC-type bacteriocin/lantibiotic exporter with double-glycine peptidase domain